MPRLDPFALIHAHEAIDALALAAADDLAAARRKLIDALSPVTEPPSGPDRWAEVERRLAVAGDAVAAFGLADAVRDYDTTDGDPAERDGRRVAVALLSAAAEDARGDLGKIVGRLRGRPELHGPTLAALSDLTDDVLRLYGLRARLAAAATFAVELSLAGVEAAAVETDRLSPQSRAFLLPVLAVLADATDLGEDDDRAAESITADDSLDALRDLEADARDTLKGKELMAVDFIRRRGGRMSLADLAVHLEWANPPDNWNSMRQRLNSKLKRRGWVFGTHNGSATVIASLGVSKPLSATGRK